MADSTNKCADCKKGTDITNAYFVCPPLKGPTPDWASFWLCEDCWDRIVSDAVMARVR